MMFVRALTPLIVMSEKATRSLLMPIVPAGTLMMSAMSFVDSDAAMAARRLTHVCAVALHEVVASLDPLVTVHVSAWAGAASASAATPAVRAARRRISGDPNRNPERQARAIRTGQLRGTTFVSWAPRGTCAPRAA